MAAETPGTARGKTAKGKAGKPHAGRTAHAAPAAKHGAQAKNIAPKGTTSHPTHVATSVKKRA